MTKKQYINRLCKIADELCDVSNFPEDIIPGRLEDRIDSLAAAIYDRAEELETK